MFWFRTAAATICVAATGACATNPATGHRQFSLVSESKEIAMGLDAAKDVSTSIGLVHDEALTAYVSGLAMPIAKSSERPLLPWSFSIVEDPAVNAFALPGGPVFVTRGILAYMNSEAQLVSVLGHEMGHITARHSASQLSKQQLAQIAVVGTVLIRPGLSQFSDLASQGLSVAFLKFSRDDETQADGLGFRYMTRAGYDPHEMAAMFHTLDRMQASGEGKTPQWLSTHPDPGNRVQATNDRIAAAKLQPGGRVERESFLKRVDGLVFGEDPRNGFFRGTAFMHPTLRFEFDFPAGWKTENQATKVAAISATQDAIVTLTTASNTTPSQALNQFLNQQAVVGRGTSAAAINGLPAASAAFTATTSDGAVAGYVACVDLDGTTYKLMAFSTGAKSATYDATLRTSVMSFRRLTDVTAINVQPARVRLVRIDRAMTIEQFNTAHPSTVPVATVALINGVETGATIPAGTLLKRVTVDR